MNYADIKDFDIADGEGVRCGLYVSGCERHCFNCHNREAQSFDYGRPFDNAAAEHVLGVCRKPYIAGLSVLGGEPFSVPNQRTLVDFLRRFRNELPSKSIWVWTGCVLEKELLKPSIWRCEVTDDMLGLIDILVDGPYVEALRDPSLAFRGSSNQRIIRLH